MLCPFPNCSPFETPRWLPHRFSFAYKPSQARGEPGQSRDPYRESCEVVLSPGRIDPQRKRQRPPLCLLSERADRSPGLSSARQWLRRVAPSTLDTHHTTDELLDSSGLALYCA